MSKTGIVYLVGAGPGDPGLITLNGLDALQRSDVVVFDRLAPAGLLKYAKANAELISAAKSPANVALTQAEINDVLIDRAREGKSVCRLKGGDPFVFGRGGEEAIALSDAQVPFTVVPGISSAIGAAAYAGIPVTHRGLASSVTVVTGSEMQDPPNSGVNWEAVAKTGGTAVVLMGASRIEEITSTLISHGRRADEPAAAVQQGTSTEQRTITSTLSGIATGVQNAGLTAPIALVIGEVVALRERISWFDTRPLFGKRILVTRARSQVSRLASGLTELGAEVVECPVIKSTSMEDTTELDASLANLNQYEWVAFASPNGVNQAFERMDHLGLDARAFASCKIAAVGPATVAALKTHGIDADLTPDAFTAEGLVGAFRANSDKPKNAVVFRSDIGRETIPKGLRQLGADVTEVAAYRTVAEEQSAANAHSAFQEGIDVVTFTSSSTVKNLRHLLEGDVTPINNGVVVCMGPVTASTAESFGIEVDIIPEEQSIPGIIAAIRSYFEFAD
ncbi:MAG: uroporphyrinogen-III C-methyltransferase [Chloroflexi bacterium]|nr:uroporphyrinogen-III C-methyltransferase [Chloroflexota bacterium]